MCPKASCFNECQNLKSHEDLEKSLKSGAKITELNTYFRSTMDCCENLQQFEVLLAHGLNVSDLDRCGSSFLHTCRCPQVIEVLVKTYGLDPNQLNHSGSNPLHSQTEPDCIRMLLKLGSDPETVNDYGESVTRYPFKRCIEVFREHSRKRKCPV